MKKLFLFLILLFFVSCRHPYFYEVSTRPWLYELSKKYGKNITKLKDIPTEEFDSFAENGVDIVWMMGIWKLGEYGIIYDRNFTYENYLPDWTVEDIIGSPFAITEYVCNPELGTDDDIFNLRIELNIRGIKLMLDFVPNHSAHDSEKAYSDPFMYIRAPGGITDESRFNSRGLAFGSDMGRLPWKDVIQYNYWEYKTIEYMKDNFKKVLTLADAAICNRAYLILNDIFQESWRAELNAYNYTKPEQEFWTYAIEEVKKINPNSILLAEAYNEDYSKKLIELGFDYAYDKTLIEKIFTSTSAVKEYMKSKDSTFLDTSCHFAENHDELRIAFKTGGDYNKAMAVGTLAATFGGMIFINHGQWEGKKNKLDIHLRRATYESDNLIVKNYYRKLSKVLLEPAFRSSNFYFVDNMTGQKKDDFIAYIKEEGDNHFIVIVNFSSTQGCAYVPIHNIKGYRYCLVHEALSDQEYIKTVKDAQSGMLICLDAWESQIFQYNY